MPVLSFKIDPEGARRIRANARAEKTSLSAFLRKAALGSENAKPVRVLRKQHPISGLQYNAAHSGRKVTDEEIRSALADFP
jgi:hypothetical protein